MAAERPRRRKKRQSRSDPDQPQDRRHAKTTLKLRRIAGSNEWELVHPPCARDRALDLEEVQQMIDAGEVEIARDELRWLLEDCHDFLDAHALLGELALAEEDLKLSRAHFGYAYQIGEAALREGHFEGTLPYGRAANKAFLEAAKGLAWCLIQLGNCEQANDVLRRMLVCDPSDPLSAGEMLRS